MAETSEQEATDRERAAWFRQLAGVVKDTESLAAESKRRMWRSRDEVTRLRTVLAAAEAECAAAEREHEEAVQFLYLAFGHMKQEYEAGRA